MNSCARRPVTRSLPVVCHVPCAAQEGKEVLFEFLEALAPNAEAGAAAPVGLVISEEAQLRVLGTRTLLLLLLLLLLSNTQVR